MSESGLYTLTERTLAESAVSNAYAIMVTPDPCAKKEIKECESGPCLHGACLDGIGRFECQCDVFK